MRSLLQAEIGNASFAQLHEGQTLAHRPKIVTLDGKNAVLSVNEMSP